MRFLSLVWVLLTLSCCTHLTSSLSFKASFTANGNTQENESISLIVSNTGSGVTSIQVEVDTNERQFAVTQGNTSCPVTPTPVLSASSSSSSSSSTSSFSMSSSSSVFLLPPVVLPALPLFVDSVPCPLAYYTVQNPYNLHWAGETMTEVAAAWQFHTQGTPRMQGNWSTLVFEAESFYFTQGIGPYPISAFPTGNVDQGHTTSVCTVVVSVNTGSDVTGDGSITNPLATITRALLLTRQCTPSIPATILLRQGTYYFNQTIVLTSNDDGLSIIGYPAEDVVFSGSVIVPTPSWRSEGSNIYSTVIPSWINTNYNMAMNTIYDNTGTRLQFAIYPNTASTWNSNICPQGAGTQTATPLSQLVPPGGLIAQQVQITNVRGGSPFYNDYDTAYGGQASFWANNQSYWASTNTAGGGASLFYQWGSVQFATGASPRLSTWKNYTDAQFVYRHELGWGMYSLHISDVSTQSGTATFDYGGFQLARTATDINCYFVQGVYQELDAVGEWYFDHAQNRLYVMFGSTPAPYLQISQTVSFFNLTGTSNITFSSITFMNTASAIMYPHVNLGGADNAAPIIAAITIVDSLYTTVKYSLFTSLGSSAVLVYGSSNGTHIHDCEISNSAMWGVQVFGVMNGYNAALEHTQPWNTIIERNLFYNLGLVNIDGGGVVIQLAYPTKVLYCACIVSPDSCINVGDGFAGGHEIGYIVAINTFGAEGSFSAWNRMPYLNLRGTWFPAQSRLHHVYSTGMNILSLDDGSNQWITDHTVVTGQYGALAGTSNFGFNLTLDSNILFAVYNCWNPGQPTTNLGLTNSVCWYMSSDPYGGEWQVGANNFAGSNSFANNGFQYLPYNLGQDSLGGSIYSSTRYITYPCVRFAMSDLLGTTCNTCNLYSQFTPQCSNPSLTFVPGNQFLPLCTTVFNAPYYNPTTYYPWTSFTSGSIFNGSASMTSAHNVTLVASSGYTASNYPAGLLFFQTSQADYTNIQAYAYAQPGVQPGGYPMVGAYYGPVNNLNPSYSSFYIYTANVVRSTNNGNGFTSCPFLSITRNLTKLTIECGTVVGTQIGTLNVLEVDTVIQNDPAEFGIYAWSSVDGEYVTALFGNITYTAYNFTSVSSSSAAVVSSSSSPHLSSSVSSSVVSSLSSSSSSAASGLTCSYTTTPAFAGLGSYTTQTPGQAYTITDTVGQLASSSNEAPVNGSFLYLNTTCDFIMTVTIQSVSGSSGVNSATGIILTNSTTQWDGANFITYNYGFGNGYFAGGGVAGRGFPQYGYCDGNLNLPFTFSLSFVNHTVTMISNQQFPCGANPIWYLPSTTQPLYIGLITSGSGVTQSTVFTGLQFTPFHPPATQAGGFSVYTYGMDANGWIIPQASSTTSFVVGSGGSSSTQPPPFNTAAGANGTFVYKPVSGNFQFNATFTGFQDGIYGLAGCVYMSNLASQTVLAYSYYNFFANNAFNFANAGGSNAGNSNVPFTCTISQSGGVLTTSTTGITSSTGTAAASGFVGLFVNNGLWEGPGYPYPEGFQAVLFTNVSLS